MLFRGRTMFAPTRKNPNIAKRKSKNALSIPSASKLPHARHALSAGVHAEGVF